MLKEILCSTANRSEYSSLIMHTLNAQNKRKRLMNVSIRRILDTRFQKKSYRCMEIEILAQDISNITT